MTNLATPQKTYLFTDFRHIRCGDLQWFSPKGDSIPLIGSREPAIKAYSKTGFLPHGVRLVAQKANKTEPLPPNTIFGRVIFESGRYRMYFLSPECPKDKDFGAYSNAIPKSVAICYTESKDGFIWSKPKKCQIKVPGQTAFDGFTFFKDPKGIPEERYKAVYTAIPPEGERKTLWEGYQHVHLRYQDTRLTSDYIYCMYGVGSPDGIYWKPINKPLMVHKSDTDTTVYYDSWLDRYVMYTRLYWQERRWVGRAEAEDFRHWGPVQPLIWPNLAGSLSDDIYTNGRTEYPGLSNYHLMYPMIYHRYNQTSEIRLFSSADGICWSEVPGGPVISPGEPDEWDGEFIGAGKDLVPIGNDRIGILYFGTSFPHKYPRWENVLKTFRVAWAYWTKGRLSAIVADEEGEFFTFPIRPSGRKILLNIRTRKGGMVRVGLVGVSGRSVDECAPISGDNIAEPVRWKGKIDIGVKEGNLVTLHFKLRSAELFGFEFI